MLDVRRADLRDFLRSRGETWLDDPANENLRFARARARQALGADAPARPHQIRTPPSIVAKLNAQLNLATQEGETRERLLEIGMEPEGGGSAAFSGFVKNEIGKWARVIKATGLKAE